MNNKLKFSLFLLALTATLPLHAADFVEFRRALLINQEAVDTSGHLKSLKQDLESAGFVVTVIMDSQHTGWTDYQNYLRSVPTNGVNVIYYRGEMDVKENGRYPTCLLRIGDYKSMPSNQRKNPKPPPKKKNTTTAPRTPQAQTPQALSQLAAALTLNSCRLNAIFFDLTKINNITPRKIGAESEASSKKKGKTKGPLAGPSLHKAVFSSTSRLYTHNRVNTPTITATNKPGQSWLADKILPALKGTLNLKEDSAKGSFATPRGKSLKLNLRHQAGKVISPPDTMIKGQQAGDHWLDRNGLVFVWCPPGSFQMGDKEQLDAQPVEVTLNKGYWLSKYELTQANGRLLYLNMKGDKGGNNPLCGIEYGSAAGAIKSWQGQLKKVKLAYPGWSYDLPTEAEWEYAARAGNDETEKLPFMPAKLAQYANFADRTLVENNQYGTYTYASMDAADGYGQKPAPVGQFKPNNWGFHDMLGNVSEWVNTFYESKLIGGTNPNNLHLAHEKRSPRNVIRGGAWCSPARYLHPAHRSVRTFPGKMKFYPYEGVRIMIRQGDALSPPQKLVKMKGKK